MSLSDKVGPPSASRGRARCVREARHGKTRRFQRVHEERMMGLEPTTFTRT
jgi:hypothetical protein